MEGISLDIRFAVLGNEFDGRRHSSATGAAEAKHIYIRMRHYGYEKTAIRGEAKQFQKI
jgi:hypothetical protein